MDEIRHFFSESASGLSKRHPLFKLLLGAGLLAVCLGVPDRSPAVVILKLGLIAGLGASTAIYTRWGSWLRALLLLAGFLLVLFAATGIGIWITGKGNLDRLGRLALRSFWAVNISFLIAMSFHFRETVYLSALLKIPAFISSQVLLIFHIWRKLLNEFRQVPLAWRSRGIGSGRIGKDPKSITMLLKVIFLRTVHRVGRLERALLNRGFDGEFFTFWGKPWLKSDTLALAVAAAAAVILIGVAVWNW
jgi:energy-coupling factor transporter transmembrane protein EcfT